MQFQQKLLRCANAKLKETTRPLHLRQTKHEYLWCTLPSACSFKTARRMTAHILKHLLHGKVTEGRPWLLLKGVPGRHLLKLFLPAWMSIRGIHDRRYCEKIDAQSTSTRTTAHYSSSRDAKNENPHSKICNCRSICKPQRNSYRRVQSQ